MYLAHHISRLVTATFILVTAATGAFAADDGNWTVSKSSGEVWLTNSGAHVASLKQEEFLKPGDTIRTGRNGRVLLRRGEETMMISPNSVVGVPTEKKEGLSTTIIQQAGSILLEVEKRNVKHFEVETPYLAAVVKGTQFRVTVNAAGTSVDVIRGQVEVADFKTGQIAQVQPGQHATTFAHSNGGLSLSGSGAFSPIEQGKPRTPSIERVPVPKAGLVAPRNVAIGQTMQSLRHAARGDAARISTEKVRSGQPRTPTTKAGITRISSPIGEVHLNFHKVTNGLARDNSSAHGAARSSAHNETIWNSSSSGNASVSSTSTGNSGNVSSAISTSTVTSTSSTAGTSGANVAVITGTNSGNGNGSSNGNGSGANGNGKNNNANNGNGNSGGNGNGNNGNNGNNGKHRNGNNGNNGNGNNGNGNNANNGNGNSGNHGNGNNGNGNSGNGNNGNNGNGNNGNGNGHGKNG